MASPSPSPAAAASARKPTFVQGGLCGGLAAMGASAVTHPLDLFKVRLQLSGELDASRARPSVIATLRSMMAREGVAGFYNGLSASLVRQALYSPARFGLFQTLMNERLLSAERWSNWGMGPIPPAALAAMAAPSTLEKLGASLLGGCVGGLLSSPADLVMVRMQADGRLAGSARRNYSGFLAGFTAVARDGGLRGLFRGAAPNVQRAMITTATQFTSYDFFKGVCRRHLAMRDSVGMHFVASMMAGVVVASAASPMDVLRTRMMNSRKAPVAPAAAAPAAPAVASAANANAVTAAASAPARAFSSAAPAPASVPASGAYARAYSSTMDCLLSTLRVEGPRGLYKGFLPYYLRVAPQVTLMFVFFEQLNAQYARWVV